MTGPFDFLTTLSSGARVTLGGGAVAALGCSPAETTRPVIIVVAEADDGAAHQERAAVGAGRDLRCPQPPLGVERPRVIVGGLHVCSLPAGHGPADSGNDARALRRKRSNSRASYRCVRRAYSGRAAPVPTSRHCAPVGWRKAARDGRTMGTAPPTTRSKERGSPGRRVAPGPRHATCTANGRMPARRPAMKHLRASGGLAPRGRRSRGRPSPRRIPSPSDRRRSSTGSSLVGRARP